MNIKTLGINLAKNIFQLHSVDAQGRLAINCVSLKYPIPEASNEVLRKFFPSGSGFRFIENPSDFQTFPLMYRGKPRGIISNSSTHYELLRHLLAKTIFHLYCVD